tara:strand:- start:274 stop:783 length:510 start_codon:yes stop_codon:yes gene_type:complete
MSKPGKSLKELCKKLGVRLTVKRGKKRVYKSIAVLKRQCAKKRKVKKKKKVKRKRRSKFGAGPEIWSPSPPIESANAPTPSMERYGDEQDKLIFLSPGSSPSDSSIRRRTGIRAVSPPPFSFDSPLSPILINLGNNPSFTSSGRRGSSDRLQGLFNSLYRGEPVNRRLF